MKKIIVLLLGSFMIFSFSQAAVCPFGMVNDPYPGQCGRYIDRNGDQICDLSQNTVDKQQQPTVEANNKVSSTTQAPTSSTVSVKGGVASDGILVLILALGLIVSYFISLLLVKTKKISSFGNKLFWNSLLLISFLVLGVTSAVLVLRSVYEVNFSGYSLWLRAHTIAGVAMLLLSIFHTFWHGKYWCCYFRSRKKKENCSNDK